MMCQITVYRPIVTQIGLNVLTQEGQSVGISSCWEVALSPGSQRNSPQQPCIPRKQSIGQREQSQLSYLGLLEYFKNYRCLLFYAYQSRLTVWQSYISSRILFFIKELSTQNKTVILLEKSFIKGSYLCLKPRLQTRWPIFYQAFASLATTSSSSVQVGGFILSPSNLRGGVGVSCQSWL